jgi:ADP-ribose pyrophosphatase YjhB (NUDIX family)
MDRPHTHCPDCGAQLPEGDFPQTCEECETTHFLNPTPVAVLVQPVGDGVLTVRRDIPPHNGELALPGGFIGLEESWEEAAVRELREETGVEVDAADVDVFDVESAPDGTVLIFGRGPQLGDEAIADFSPTDEVTELVVVERPRELAFALHTDVLERWAEKSA